MEAFEKHQDACPWLLPRLGSGADRWPSRAGAAAGTLRWQAKGAPHGGALHSKVQTANRQRRKALPSSQLAGRSRSCGFGGPVPSPRATLPQRCLGKTQGDRLTTVIADPVPVLAMITSPCPVVLLEPALIGSAREEAKTGCTLRDPRRVPAKRASLALSSPFWSRATKNADSIGF